MARWLTTLGVLMVVGCGSSRGNSDADAQAAVPDAPAADAAASLPAIPWTPCSYYPPANRWDDQSTGNGAQDHLGSDLPAECAEVEVPLDWDNPNAGTITVFVKHWGSPCDRATGDGCGQAMWLLHGGPGGAGVASAAYFFQRDNPRLDVYAVDQRGTGRSTYLACPDQESVQSEEGAKISPGEWAACRSHLQSAWAGKLDHFTTTMMATDLGRLIERTRAPDQEVFTWGASYGTYWTQRYLQIFPDQATGSILHGVASAGPAGPDGMNFATYMHQYEAVGTALETLCAAHAVCSTYLGTDQAAVAAFVDDVLDNLAVPGYCDAVVQAAPDRYNRTTLRKWFGTQLLVGQTGARALPFAVVHRLKRCNAADQRALIQFASQVWDFSGGNAASSMFSQVQNMHISLSEMWADPMSLADAQAYARTCTWCFGRTERWDNDPVWPRYPRDRYIDGYADTETAVLMMNGVLDPASIDAKARIANQNLRSPHKYFFALPGTSHTIPSVLAQTASGATYDCARNMVVAFMTNPTQPPTDCTDDILGALLGYNAQLAGNFETNDCGPMANQPCVADIWRNYVYE